MTLLPRLALAEGYTDGAVAQFRDLTYIAIDDQKLLVVACDSSGGVGRKPQDVSRWSFPEAGYGATKVCLMELLAVGATPILLVNNLSVELEPTGRGILEGIRRALVEAGVQPRITGSDEVNIPTVQTGIGITLIGVVDRAKLRLGASGSGDQLLAVGRPKGAPDLDYRDSDPDIASIAIVRELLGCSGVSELLPVGSRGIRHEADELGRVAGLGVKLDPAPGLDLDHSAGTSTTVLAAVHPGSVRDVISTVSVPVFAVGTLIDPAAAGGRARP